MTGALASEYRDRLIRHAASVAYLRGLDGDELDAAICDLAYRLRCEADALARVEQAPRVEWRITGCGNLRAEVGTDAADRWWLTVHRERDGWTFTAEGPHSRDLGHVVYVTEADAKAAAERAAGVRS